MTRHNFMFSRDGRIGNARSKRKRKLNVESLEPRRVLTSIVISEVHYHPTEPNAAEVAAGYESSTDFEFLEVVNHSTTNVDLSSFQLVKTSTAGADRGVHFDFSFGDSTVLRPRQHALVVANEEAFATRYGNEVPVLGEWNGGLDDAGDTITLELTGEQFLQFTFDDDWYPSTDGQGFSLEAVNLQPTEPAIWSTAQAWKASSQVGGSPGYSQTPTPGDSNGDGQFDQEDLNLVIDAAKYGTGEQATFAEGDWDGNGVFDSKDIVLAFLTNDFQFVRSTPQGVEDSYHVSEDGRLVVPPQQGVLANDRHGIPESLSAHISSAPLYGRLQLLEDGSFEYAPDHDFSGFDSFVYIPRQDENEGDPTTVSINVAPTNDRPRARVDFYYTPAETPLDVAADRGLLSNDTDIDTMTLQATVDQPPNHGQLELSADGAFRYTPNQAFRGIDRFSYRTSDSLAQSDATTVSISVNQHHVVISEFAASVQTSLRDYDDDSSDWLEVANYDTEPVDLQGWYLTDDADDLTKWRIPSETVVEPGQSVVIFASGKDLVASNGELHANFRLARGGEYLALVDQNGTSIVWDASPRFPALIEDVSYGRSDTTTTHQLVQATSTVRLLSTDHENELDPRWTSIEFDDSTWSRHVSPIGYATQLPGSEVPGFTARMIKVGGGRVSQLETARAAESLLDGTSPREDYFIAEDVTTVVPVVNFGGIQSVTPGGDFPEAIPYPDGTTLNRLEDFAIRTTAKVSIPEGEWTIGFGSSDGGLLRLANVQFLSTTGESGDTEIIEGDGELIFNETRRRGWTTGTFVVPAGGIETTLDALFFERRAADFFEIAIVPGNNTRPSVRNGWMLLSDGVEGWVVSTIAVPSEPDFDQFLRSDLEQEMFKQHESVFMRIPFDVEAASKLDRLELRMRYDDGFKAYLNGVEVASDNVRVDDDGNSEADGDRNDIDATTLVQFDISEHRNVLRDGTNLLSIHGLNADAGDSGTLFAPELIGVIVHPASPSFMQPSPGEANIAGQIGLLNPPGFSVPNGTFRDPFLLELTSNDPQGIIRYTTDGSIPTENSPIFRAPIGVLVSSQVRARTFLTDHMPSPTASALYVRLGDGVHDFDSDLPLLVFDTMGQEVPRTNTTEFVDSIAALFDVQDSGQSRLVQTPDLISRAGFRARGSSSASFPKSPFRIEFRQDHSDDDRDVDLLGLPSDSDFVLVPGYEFDRSMNRNTIVYDLSNQAGRYAVRTRYVEVFVNSGRGEVTPNDYLGVYPLMESVKVGDNRLDIGSLAPQYVTEPDVTGGYIFKVDRVNPGDRGVRLGEFGTVAMVRPDETALDERPAQRSYLVEYVTDFMEALQAPDFMHPELGLHYREWIDVGSAIDHYILYELWQATDALFFSGYWFKPRDGKLQAGPIWDFDRSAGSTDPRNNNPRRWHAIDSAPRVWWDLFVDIEFRQAFIDRWSELQQGVLSNENLVETYDRVTGQISDEAAARNFARWPEKPPRSNGGVYDVLDGTWQGEVQHMKLWLQDRLHWMNSLFLQAPQFSIAREGRASIVTLRGDLNRDNAVDAVDIALLSREVSAGTNNSDFDLTADGNVDWLDLLAMAKRLDTVPGDVDVDGDVDAADEAILLANLQQPPNMPTTWLDADFDADGDIDETDRELLIENLGFDRVETLPEGRTIYYTTDGSDPRLPGGGISPSAREFQGSFEIDASATIFARAYDPDFNIPVRGFQQDLQDAEAWSGLTTLRIPSG